MDKRRLKGTKSLHQLDLPGSSQSTTYSTASTLKDTSSLHLPGKKGGRFVRAPSLISEASSTYSKASTLKDTSSLHLPGKKGGGFGRAPSVISEASSTYSKASTLTAGSSSDSGNKRKSEETDGKKELSSPNAKKQRHDDTRLSQLNPLASSTPAVKNSGRSSRKKSKESDLDEADEDREKSPVLSNPRTSKESNSEKLMRAAKEAAAKKSQTSQKNISSKQNSKATTSKQFPSNGKQQSTRKEKESQDSGDWITTKKSSKENAAAKASAQQEKAQSSEDEDTVGLSPQRTSTRSSRSTKARKQNTAGKTQRGRAALESSDDEQEATTASKKQVESKKTAGSKSKGASSDSDSEDLSRKKSKKQSPGKENVRKTRGKKSPVKDSSDEEDARSTRNQTRKKEDAKKTKAQQQRNDSEDSDNGSFRSSRSAKKPSNKRQISSDSDELVIDEDHNSTRQSPQKTQPKSNTERLLRHISQQKNNSKAPNSSSGKTAKPPNSDKSPQPSTSKATSSSAVTGQTSKAPAADVQMSSEEELFDSSPKRTPPRNNQVVERRPSPRKMRNSRPVEINTDDPEVNEFIEFLKKCGFQHDLEYDGFVADEDVSACTKKFQSLLDEGEIMNVQQVLKAFEKFAENADHLKKAVKVIRPQNATNVNEGYKCFGVSLLKILLQNPKLQTGIATCVLRQLRDLTVFDDSQLPWTNALLQQFRFLDDIVQKEIMSDNLIEILEECPEYVQCDLILMLPEIIPLSQHVKLAEALEKLMNSNIKLMNLILDCFTNLSLGQGFLEEVKEKVATAMNTLTDTNILPSMIRFVLSICKTPESRQKAWEKIHVLNLEPLMGKDVETCYTHQLLAVEEMNLQINLHKEMQQSALAVVKTTHANGAMPLDLVILLLLSQVSQAKKKALEVFLKQHVKSGYYRQSLLTTLYTHYKQVARSLQKIAMEMAGSLLKSEEHAYVDFASEWLRLQFMSHSDKKSIFNQREVMHDMMLLMASGRQMEKNILAVLYKMASHEEERKCLYSYSAYFARLLNKIPEFDLGTVAIVCDLLHNLCGHSATVSDMLKDDLSILISKQLASGLPLNKGKGVLNAVMSIKHQALRGDTVEAAIQLIDKILNAVQWCQRSRILFYEQLAQVLLDTPEITGEFVNAITERFQNYFAEEHVITDRTLIHNDLEPKFCLIDDSNSSNPSAEDLSVYFGKGAYGSIVPALFKLLRTCLLRCDEGRHLSSVNKLLGCNVLMPKDLSLPEPDVLNHMLYCINWFREIINGFVTQEDQIIQEEIVFRLEQLMTLQGDFCVLLATCDNRYQPPACYFDQFPVPAFVKIEKKSGKKGRKKKEDKPATTTGVLPEWETWEMGFALSSKNPMYFRKLDPQIAHLLDMDLNLDSSQMNPKCVSKAQVCYICKELIAMMDKKMSATLICDLIKLLPKICSKLDSIVDELRERDSDQCREAVRLIFCLITKIFNWRDFSTAMYQRPLRDGLRSIAAQVSPLSVNKTSGRELVSEATTYIQSMGDISARIAIAVALVECVQTLTKHSQSFAHDNKGHLAKLAQEFLAVYWDSDDRQTPVFRSSVATLLGIWMDNEPSPLDSALSTLEWLSDQAKDLETSKDTLKNMCTISRSNFHQLFKQIFNGIIRGAKILLQDAENDPERINVWIKVVHCVGNMTKICKTMNLKTCTSAYLRSMTNLVKLFLTTGMPVLEVNLKFQVSEVEKIVKGIQTGTRVMHQICCEGSKNKDVTMIKLVPAAKTVLEKFVYSVKVMLVSNKSGKAFWLGNLKNKGLHGDAILSQEPGSDDVTSASNAGDPHSDDTEMPDSDILDEVDDDMDIDEVNSDSD